MPFVEPLAQLLQPAPQARLDRRHRDPETPCDFPRGEPLEVAQQDRLAAGRAEGVEGPDQLLAQLEAHLELLRGEPFVRSPLFPLRAPGLAAPAVGRQVARDPRQPAAQLAAVLRRTLERPLPHVLDQIVRVLPDEIGREPRQEGLVREQLLREMGRSVGHRTRSVEGNTAAQGGDSGFRDSRPQPTTCRTAAGSVAALGSLC